MDREQLFEYLAFYITTGTVLIVPYHVLCIYFYQKGYLDSDTFYRLTIIVPPSTNFFSLKWQLGEIFLFLLSLLFLFKVWKEKRKQVIAFFLVLSVPAGYLYYELYSAVKEKKEKQEIRGALKGLPLKVEGRDGEAPHSEKFRNTQESH